MSEQGSDRPTAPAVVSTKPFQPPSRGQWVALVVAVGASLLMAVGLPAAASSTVPEDETLVAGTRVAAGGVSIEPTDSWVKDAQSPELLDIAKQESQILLFPATPSTDSAIDTADRLVEVFRGDKSGRVEITEPESFETTTGVDGAKAVVIEADNVTLIYAFTNGTSATTSQVSLSGNSWKELGPEIDQMMATVDFEGGAS